ncbi:glutathione S-transferase [Pseudahrensia aquimaris]|uniref:Glutathione S-transferase n=1 Tax=Pseudahrensia aquimaris TaxID=744461 RepID=A0ABW3FCB3_9HYPH
MKLYDGGLAPNPRRVRIFMAEKGIDIPLEPVDMTQLGHKSDEITRRNPLQRLPILELNDGTIISESVAICRYLERLHPEPPLMGVGAKDEAIVEMWQRRMEMNFLLLVANVFRHAHRAMAEWEVPQIKEFSESNRPKVMKTLEWLNDELSEREFIAGDRYTIADITALVSMDFMKPARLETPPEFTNLLAWHERVRSRPSAKA